MTTIFEMKKNPKALIKKASGDLVLAGAEGLAACFALLWLADRCRATVTGSPLLAKNSPQDCFLNAQTLSGSSLYQKKKSRTSATLSFWQGQKDLPRASHSYGSPTVAVQQ